MPDLASLQATRALAAEARRQAAAAVASRVMTPAQAAASLHNMEEMLAAMEQHAVLNPQQPVPRPSSH